MLQQMQAFNVQIGAVDRRANSRAAGMQRQRPGRLSVLAMAPASGRRKGGGGEGSSGIDKSILMDSKSSARFQSAEAKAEGILDKYQPGELVQGVVRSIMPYGAFVDLGDITGLLHRSQISNYRIKHGGVDQILQEGDQLMVLVLQTDRNRSRLTLSTKKLEPKPGDMLRDPQRVFENAAETFQKREEAEGILDKYQPGDLVQGVVSLIKPYGAFVDLGEITGLLHISQISHERIVGVDQILQEGDQLKVLVLQTNRKNRSRLTLSTKKLERVPGDMLRDPQRVFEDAHLMAETFQIRRSVAEGEAQSVDG
ncbi:hypothetical protein DUNSADRAFT_17119 [Dunaliella salina]|uniref:S1 motif domain-containing protein n=1 Tax=Dunaliella salina TaxID=3046 RepID=A0ABQ7G2C7_DUNSA|nr:hypothetical protein DUNSADRAFT_17119 [Dunaliella salina]|eukprot:KAF5828757.1 hypothetical protein DUNSADRAFT_17119 [Dunaliella salina]